MNQTNPASMGESTSRRNVYEIVTEQIIRQLEQGVAPWHKPWRTEAPCNLVSGKPYRGINPFLLGSQGYGSRYWLTFNQANKLGGHICKGEKSSIVTFWHVGEEKTIRDADGNTRNSKPFLLRYYRVFNIEQTEGIADKLGLGNACGSPKHQPRPKRGGSWLSTPEYDHRVDTARRLWTARTRLRVQRTHIKDRRKVDPD